jgi:hypothetical protein
MFAREFERRGLVDRYAKFDPKKHPRGQPENAGWFAEKNSGDQPKQPPSSPGQKGLFGEGEDEHAAEPAPKKNPYLDMFRQVGRDRQDTFWHGMNDLPGQQSLFGDLDRGAAASGSSEPAGGQGALFTSEELSLPTRKTAPQRDQASAYGSAQANAAAYRAVMNMGRGISKEIGAQVAQVDSPEGMREAVRQMQTHHRPVILLSPLKGAERAAQKARDKYDGDWGRMQDLLRSTIAIDSLDQLPQVIAAARKHIQGNGWKLATRPESTLDNPSPSGYRDMKLAIEAPDGHIAEIQIHLKSMLAAKELGGGHAVYEEYRQLDEAIKARMSQGGSTATVEEKQRLDAWTAQMRKIYDTAWSQQSQKQGS